MLIPVIFFQTRVSGLNAGYMTMDYGTFAPVHENAEARKFGLPVNMRGRHFTKLNR